MLVSKVGFPQNLGTVPLRNIPTCTYEGVSFYKQQAKAYLVPRNSVPNNLRHSGAVFKLFIGGNDTGLYVNRADKYPTYAVRNLRGEIIGVQHRIDNGGTGWVLFKKENALTLSTARVDEFTVMMALTDANGTLKGYIEQSSVTYFIK